ncbi:MAG: mechanosensitive ion channel [Caldilineaceae bacterium]|nr:mechanosensitive ion channel [Caldilineaceae bacterium]
MSNPTDIPFFDLFSIFVLPLFVQRLLLVGVYSFLAWMLLRMTPFFVRPVIFSRARFSRRIAWNDRRVETLTGLVVDLVRAFIILVALIFALSLYVNSTGLFTFLGLFSAAFGLGARPLVSDYISGIIFLFEDLYTIGEKVEIFGVEGTVEDINLRTTHMRAPSGELFIVPNGEIRNVRNFARGTFSLGTVQVDVKSRRLDEVSTVLNQVAEAAAAAIPELISPPEIISADGVIGAQTRFTLFAKTEYGKGAIVRRRLLQLIHEALAEAGVEVGD